MSDAGTTTLIFGVVIGTILCDYALTLVSSLLNYRALDQPLPAEFSTVYEPAAYARSQAYTKAKSVHSLLHGSFDLAVLLLFWLVFGILGVQFFGGMMHWCVLYVPPVLTGGDHLLVPMPQYRNQSRY